MIEIQNLERITNIKNADGSRKTKAEVMYEISLHIDKKSIPTGITFYTYINNRYNNLLEIGIIQEEK